MKSGKLSITLLVFLGSFLLLSSIFGADISKLKQLKETDLKVIEVEKLTKQQVYLKDSNVIYSENFDRGSNLTQLGFTGTAPTYWTLDTDQKNMASTCPANGSSIIYTPQFEASRKNHNITVAWTVSPAGRDLFKLVNRGEVSLFDTKGIPVYSLVYASNPNTAGIEVSLFKYKREQPLGSAVIPIFKSAQPNYNFNFRIDLNCHASGGDIIVYYNDRIPSNYYIQRIKVKDETYLSFSKLKFGYQRGKAEQIAIDNIRVMRSYAFGLTVAITATPKPTPTPPVDLKPPVTQIVLDPAPNGDGWASNNVQVYFTSADDVSGVRETQYKIDGGAVLIYDRLNPSVITTNGPHTVEYRSVDNAGREEAWRSASFKIDQLAPDTTASPDPGLNWHKGDFTLNFIATDNAGGSGVKEIRYQTKVGAGAYGPVSVSSGSSGAVAVNTEGVNTVKYWAVDNAGNVEAAREITVKIDKTKPVTQATVSPPPNPARWNNSDVTISFSATDSGGSGVAETRHKINGVPADGATAGPAPITTEGIHQVNYWSIDRVGNVEAEKAVEVKLDKTPPSITGLRPNNFHYQTLRPEFKATFTDTLSGIDAASIKLYLKAGPVSGTDFGPELSGHMESSPNGNNINMTFTPDHDLAAGVNYTVTYQVLDHAGNEKYVSRTFVIDP